MKVKCVYLKVCVCLIIEEVLVYQWFTSLDLSNRTLSMEVSDTLSRNIFRVSRGSAQESGSCRSGEDKSQLRPQEVTR